MTQILPYGIEQDSSERVITRTFRFPLILSRAEVEHLHRALDVGHLIREAIVEERIQNRKENREKRERGEKTQYVTLTQQRKDVAAWLKQHPEYNALIHSQVAQEICRSIDNADKAWLKDLKKTKKAGAKATRKPARHRPRKNFRSLSYPQYGNGVRLYNGRIEFSKLGTFNIRDYRKVTGTKKTVSLVWRQGRFFVCITAQQQAEDWFSDKEAWSDKPTVGGDPGLAALMTMSDGQVYDPPRRLKEALKNLRVIQREVSRKFEYRKKAWKEECQRRKEDGEEAIALRDFPRSKRLDESIRKLGKAHAKVENCRNYDHAKVASILRDSYSLMAIEEHGVMFMIQNRRQAKSASDRAISNLKIRIRSSIEPERLFWVSTTDEERNGNTQTCTCGARVEKTLKDRHHDCSSCGRTGQRDVVSADRVHLRAFGHTTWVSGQGVQGIDPKRGGSESGTADRRPGSQSKTGCRASNEAQTSKATCGLGQTSGGEPTEEDKTRYHGEECCPGSDLSCVNRNPKTEVTGSPLL